MNKKISHGTILLLAIVSVAFHLWLVFSSLYPNLVTRPLHLALALPWVFIIGKKSRFQAISGTLLTFIGVAICFWIAYSHEDLLDQYGSLETEAQYFWGVGLILIVLEMARRQVKLALPLVAAICIAYGLFGDLLPSQFSHAGIPLDTFLGTLVITEGGLWGSLTGISVSVISVFIILGAFVSAGEGGNAFMNLAVKLAGKYRAGSAKVSILSSAFFGSISGSASANVASTGAITLPAMKRLGYPPSFAAAVEAVASTGGQIMPPLMGAGAFLMVELLRVSYVEIMEAAILPALLFFFCTWVGVDHFAKRYNLKGIAKDQLPTWYLVFRLSSFFFLPFATLLVILFCTTYTAQVGATAAIAVTAVMLIANRNGLDSFENILEKYQQAIINSAKQISTVASIIICAGLIIGVLNLTGLGVKITSMILSFSGGNLWIALLLTALACLILGMEVPTTAAYAICISVAGPALETLGLPPLYSHLFVFWYALLSTITPPVCGTVFIASSMANAPWLQVAMRAMRLGLGLYIVPLAMVANPSLIKLTTEPFFALIAAIKIGVGLWLISYALTGNNPSKWRPLAALLIGGLVIFMLPVGSLS
ncbi:TRAP transporter fused permease subunit [Vibrio sp. SS-MA-C1-2]|uniref:TRAP transporter permease n=1 Tax=Vibrio sp. SS-MA-C1-2 TaxID=2908646 RepID=UPI001F1D114E|nr:TRAP transporter fused permease subunit [Vibrio sp. SS-MA-C1-2]UJF17813.1 TRAP transporter fused permease subunit [Vibrio sp. SS-MA-C1-2]